MWLSENCTILAPAPKSIVELAKSDNGVKNVWRWPSVAKVPPAKIKFDVPLIELSTAICSVPLLMRVLPV